MTQITPPAEERRFAVVLLGVAAVFVAVAIFAGTVVTPWLYLVGLTAIPNVIAGVKALRGSRPSDSGDFDEGRLDASREPTK